MNEILKSTFFKSLDNERNRFYYARILILDKYERTIKSIEGRVQQGSSISINGDSSIRRTCTLNLVAEDAENDLTNIENFLSVNKKIKIAVGIEKWIDYSKDVYYYADKQDTSYYAENPYDHGFPPTGEYGKIYVDRRTMTYWKWTGRAYQLIKSLYSYEKDLVWFPLGVFVINQPSLSHTLNGFNISLSCKDKMCLLNGEMGGGLPASVTFHEYDQIIGELTCEKDPRTDKDLEPNDYTFYNYGEETYTWTREYGWEENPSKLIRVKDKDETIGGIVPRKQLIYDIIQTSVINYGRESASRVIINDVPLEIKQYVRYTGTSPLYFNSSTGQYTLNDSYLPTDKEGLKRWEEFNFNEDIGYAYTDFYYPEELVTGIGDNVCSVLDKVRDTLGNYEYFYDIDGNFVFQEKRNYLNTSYLPFEKKYDAQHWYLDNNRLFGIETNSLKLIGRENYKADYYADQKSAYTFNEGSGLISSYSNSPSFSNLKNDYHIWGKNSEGKAIHYHLAIKDQPKVMQERSVVFLKDEKTKKYTGRIRLASTTDKEEDIVRYTPLDWRAELYLQGLDVAKGGGRPDIYQQELLDLFDDIYEWGYYKEDGVTFVFEGRFKEDITRRPNTLKYFIDYLEPTDKLYGISVDDIDTKIYSYQFDKIVRIYDNEVPDYILIDQDMEENYMRTIVEKCAGAGQRYSIVDHDVYSHLEFQTIGYSAQEVARERLYQYTSYNESISLQSRPIYSLEANTRVTVEDKKSGIHGDYIIKSMTVPIGAGSMSITASRALDRI